MSIVVSALVVAIAALCVWLGVRVVNWRKRRTKWTLAVLLVLSVVVYPLSMGPACWLLTQEWKPDGAHAVVHQLFAPLLWVYRNGPEPVHVVMRWYIFLWSGSAPPAADAYIHL